MPHPDAHPLRARLPLTRRLLPLAAPVFVAWALLGLAACAPQGARPVAGFGPPPQGFAPLPPGAAGARTKVALLLPLTGPNAPLGQAMLNAATMALFDAGGPNVEFTPRDTAGSPAAAAEAARSSIADGARAIVGPLTAGETTATAPAARAANIPVLAFTNDATLAGNGVWTLGVTPAQQVRRVILSARAGGVRRVGLVAPEDAFGSRLAAALREAAAEAGMAPPVIVTYPPSSPRAPAAARFVSEAGEGLGLVIMGESGPRAREMAAALTAAGLRPPTRLMGHALWASDTALTNDPALAGALIPGPDPSARTGFESRYLAAFGERPPRLAATAYDAAAIAARAIAVGGTQARLPIAEQLPGADGALRILPDGTVQRALALYELQPGAEPRPIEPPLLPGAAGS